MRPTDPARTFDRAGSALQCDGLALDLPTQEGTTWYFVKKYSALVMLIYVVSLALAAWGHCWPMLQARALGHTPMLASASHEHHDHGARHEPASLLCAADLVPDVVKPATTSPDIAPLKAVAIVTTAATFASLHVATAFLRQALRPPDLYPGMVSSHAYAAIYARTGRLLI